MLAMSPPTDEPFAEAYSVWHLDLLHKDLAEAKGRPLTLTEKTHLRGLLLGLSPQQVADVLHCSADGLRVTLSRTLYAYTRILFPSHEINYRTIPTVLAPRYHRYGQIQFVSDSSDNLLPVPGGLLSLNSQYYIERPPIEERCFETILQSGAVIGIKAPRQMGKTSLMTRILDHAKQNGCRTISLSFQVLDQDDFVDLKTFLYRFCAYVSRGLQLANRISDLWDDCLGSKVNCREYFEHYLLAASPQPLVLALDEVDRMSAYPQLATDFLGLLRHWFEEGKTRAIWQRFRLIIVHSSEVTLQLSQHQSPFNVGLQIWLRDFRPDQVWDLAHRYGQNWKAGEVENLLSLLGGHPFLLQVALYHISIQDLTLEELLQTAATEEGIFQEHLRRYLGILQQDVKLQEAMKTIVQSDRLISVKPAVAYRLLSLGLVLMVKNTVTVRCGLYRQYFRDRLT